MKWGSSAEGEGGEGRLWANDGRLGGIDWGLSENLRARFIRR